MTAEQITVVQALAAVMEDVRAVRKGDRNQQQGYAFRGIDAVVNACGPALRKHGVVVVPILEEANYRDVWQVPPIEKALQAVAAMTDLEKLARLEHLAGQYVDGEHWTAEDYTRFTEAADSARERIGAPA